MKKLTILTALIGLSLGVKAQSKQDSIFSALDKLGSVSTLDSAALSKLNTSASLYSPNSTYLSLYKQPEYRDTLSCLVNAVDTVNSINKWIKARVILNRGGIHSPLMRTTWMYGYVGMAIGPFSNKFISDTDLTGLVIMQVSIIDKNPYKTTK